MDNIARWDGALESSLSFLKEDDSQKNNKENLKYTKPRNSLEND